MAVDDHVTTVPEASDHGAPEAAAASRRRRRQRLETLRAFALGAGFPILLALIWDRAVALTGTRLIPSPYQVAVMMYDFSFGGVYDDAFSGTILIHIWKSVQRVYGGFFLAALIGIPLGMMIGRIKILRQLLDPTISLLRPIPVTAWLPLSMIFLVWGQMRRSSWCSSVRFIRSC
jgi:NitT/TauT family transport system permease protein